VIDPVRISDEPAGPDVELIELPTEVDGVDRLEDNIEDEWAWVDDIPAIPEETFPELVTYWGIYLLAYAAVRLVNDTIGPRAGKAVTVAGMSVTTLALHSLFAGSHWPELHRLMAALGDWPVAALGTFAVWSLLGIPAAMVYGLRALRAEAAPRTSP
jgi:hypothetical protein